MNFLGVIAGCVGRIVPSQNMQEVSFIRQWTFALVLLLSSFSSAGARETIAGFLQDKSVLRLTVGKEVFVFDTNDLAQIYGPRQFRPLWFDENGRMINRALNLKGAIGLAEEWALTSKDYWTPMIQSLFSQAQAQIRSSTAYPYWITVEFLLSDALLRFFRDIGTGKIAGSLVEEEFRVDLKRLRPEDFTNISNFLTNEGLDSKAFSEGWNQVASSVGPQNEIYLELLTAYRRLRKFDPALWTPTALNLTLVEGVTHPSVLEIRHKLFVLGYLVKDNQSAQFDAEIVGVVRRLQEWNLMKVDGTISPAGETLRFLNIPLLSRLRQIEISLDKIRNMPNNWGSHFVFVNSAAAEISDWSASAQDGRSKFNYYMRGVVGRIERRTPTKRDFIREAILNPTWTVPRSLLRKDKINNLIKDPHWADSAGFRFYFDGEETSPSNIPWSIDMDTSRVNMVQQPSYNNALGVVKFPLEDMGDDVYLHDTPERELFRETLRFKSSGCVRLEYPVRFAETVLQRTVSNLVPQSASQKGFETYPIRIADPIPVYLMNLTAQVGFDIRSNGRILNYKPIRFFPDYYGQDRRWAEVLSRSQNGETL